MKGMIFAAGLGTRLKPFTLHHPKALVPICGTPVLEIVIRRLQAAGVREAVVNVHHFADQIIDFLKANNNFGMKITVSDERHELLDTGGGVLLARPFLEGNEPFIVHNADIITNLDLREMMSWHASHPAMSTLLATWRNTTRYLYFDRDTNRLCGWQNLTTQKVRPAGFEPEAERYNQYAFNGIHIMEPAIFPELEKYAAEHGSKFSIMDFYLDTCRSNVFESYTPGANFRIVDVGKPENMVDAQNLWNSINK